MAKIKPFKDQDYKLLEEKHSFKNLFVDPEFPACIQSISHSGKLYVTDDDNKSILNLLEWRRPYELMEKPRFVIDDFQRRDLSQGHVANCWFIAAAGVLTMNPGLLASVIPSNQTFHESEYIGLFHFRFWLFGQWNDVVIDDRLPSYKGKLVFCQNTKEPEELWPALLEKAYAKVCGSYEAMAFGRVSDGLMDFTGGIDEIIPLHGPSVPDNMKEMIKRVIAEACDKQSLIGCAIIPQDEQTSEGCLWNGLVTGHAFSITQMKDIKTSKGIVTLVRCLNPWSNSVEWCGDWSDISRLWDEVSPEEKRKFKFSKANDGEFWMSYDDFFTNFNLLQICHCRPESMCSWALGTPSADSSSITLASWHEMVFHGEWKADESAGGSGKEGQPGDKYWLNPQYLVQFEASGNNGQEKSFTMIISLMSKQERKLFSTDKSIQLAIGYNIFKVKNDVDIRAHINEGRKFYMTDFEEGEVDSAHIPCRSVSQRFTIESGTYIIIPSTVKYNDAGQFFLRIFTDQKAAQTVTAELKMNKEKPTEDDIQRPSLDAPKQEEEIEKKTDGKGNETASGSHVMMSMEKTAVDRKEKLCVLQ